MEQEKNTTALNEQVLQQEILESNEALTLDLSNLSLAEILQKFIQIKWWLEILLGRRRKTSHYRT